MRRLLAVCVVAAACNRPDAGKSATPEPAAKAPAADRGWYGKIGPRSATPVHAPPNVFRIKGWNSRNSWIKLTEIVADGTKVEAGKEIARFEFSHEDALPWLKKRMAESQAELESARTGVTDNTRRLGSAAEVKSLAAESASLDTAKEGLVSDRDLSLIKLAARRAEIEHEAAARLAAASAAQTSSELAFLSSRAEEWARGMDRYRMYESRTRIVAPHDGWVRYAFLNHARRKLNKPDDMPSGTPFAFVAEDERLSVEFYVPEHVAGSITPGKKVQVRLPDDEKRSEAVVRSLSAFPQEIGFLRGDDELPDAREKAYAVTADFDAVPRGFSSGIEVRVEP